MRWRAKSEHPLARAILERAQSDGMTAEEVTEFQALPGNGLTAGSERSDPLRRQCTLYQQGRAHVSDEMKGQAEKLAEAGKTPLFFSRDGKLLGVIAVADVIKEDSPRAVRELQNMGIHVVMLTGDNERTAKAIGAQAGVDRGHRGRSAGRQGERHSSAEGAGQGRHGGRRYQRRSRL